MKYYCVHHFEYDLYSNVYLIISYEDEKVPNVTLIEESVSLFYYESENCSLEIKEKFKEAYLFYIYTNPNLFESGKNGRYTYNDRV